jgi:hypothetical protein
MGSKPSGFSLGRGTVRLNNPQQPVASAVIRSTSQNKNNQE